MEEFLRNIKPDYETLYATALVNAGITTVLELSYLPVATLEQYVPNNLHATVIVEAAKLKRASTAANQPAVPEDLIGLLQQVNLGLEKVATKLDTGFQALLTRVVQKHSTTASKCSNPDFQKIRVSLESVMDIDATCTPHCCVPKDALKKAQASLALAPRQQFVWDPANIENDRNNISRFCSHLEAELLPEGVFALPVQGMRWLLGKFECGPDSVEIESSETDYILVVKPVYEHLKHLLDPEQKPTTTELERFLPGMVGFYEAKTTTALKSNIGKWIAQATLQFLAGNQQRRRPDYLVVVLGDGNKHYCVHQGNVSNGRQSVHIMSPLGLEGVPETSTSSSNVDPARITTATIRALLSKSAESALANMSRIRGDSSSGDWGPEAGDEGKGNADGDSGSANHGADSASQGSSSANHRAGSASQGNITAKHGPNRKARGRNRSSDQATQECVHTVHGTCFQKHEGVEEPMFGRQPVSIFCSAGSSSDEGADEDADEDEGMVEAWREHAAAQQMMAAARHPVIYKGLGLEKPPTAYTPPCMTGGWDSVKLLPRDLTPSVAPSTGLGTCGPTASFLRTGS
mmetsp:Transcript_39170/g.87168  ORF Transcript_39170/g.87168 Transcript_39170/m.87168 type:complete len:576 (-) Transcript_39170:866-2593(-)